jgi:5'-methylthioadenosine phosphorylase
MPIKIGVIGGSGLYEIEGLTDVRELAVETPFGAPSDKIVSGVLGGVPIYFLPRHGRGHRFTPTDVPYRANICALKSLGVTHVVSFSACGSLKEDIKPGELVVLDQFFDRTRHRVDTFFGDGIVAHVSFADPVCPTLARLLYDTAVSLKIAAHWKGTYVCMEGPQFSTRAESKIYRTLGIDIVGMTNCTEARLAREAELHFATVALVTDYDCWRYEGADVDITDILQVMKENAAHARQLLAKAAPRIGETGGCGCASALATAIITQPAAIPEKRKAELRLLIEKYVK